MWQILETGFSAHRIRTRATPAIKYFIARHWHGEDWRLKTREDDFQPVIPLKIFLFIHKINTASEITIPGLLVEGGEAR
jgi:hypothetical protein